MTLRSQKRPRYSVIDEFVLAHSLVEVANCLVKKAADSNLGNLAVNSGGVIQWAEIQHRERSCGRSGGLLEQGHAGLPEAIGRADGQAWAGRYPREFRERHRGRLLPELWVPLEGRRETPSRVAGRRPLAPQQAGTGAVRLDGDQGPCAGASTAGWRLARGVAAALRSGSARAAGTAGGALRAHDAGDQPLGLERGAGGGGLCRAAARRAGVPGPEGQGFSKFRPLNN